MSIIDLLTQTTVNRVPEGSVMVLGYFDGVHIGHISLFDEAKRLAHELGDVPICIWTFDSMPKGNFRGLTTTEEKCLLLKDYGMDFAILENFDSVKSLSGKSFFSENIVRAYAPKAVICGFNFTFGKGAECNANDLCTFASEHGIRCMVVPEKKLGERTVSSTEIRRLIELGEVDSANELLGHPYTVTSVIEHGAEIGRKMGIRTINQRPAVGKVIPKNGVYCCTVTLDSQDSQKTYGGICNIGSRPTVNDDTEDITVETHIFDFDDDVYGNTVTTKLYHKIRDERKFDSVDSLRRQIEADSHIAKKLLTEILK